MFREIDRTPFSTLTSQFEPGPAPQLNWIKIEKLVVDQTYQREIGKKGRANVRSIAEHFEWSKFAPVIVAPLEGGKFAIVDGQHRTTAAALRDIVEVPCQIILADQRQQAQAFAAVNGSITRATGQQIYHAKVAAQDEAATEIHNICQISGVSIIRTHRVSTALNVGETQAIRCISRCLHKYGRETLITALQCITQTADGNAGYVRATIIEALCAVMNHRHDWRDAGSQLFRAMDDFNFPDEWDRATDGKIVVTSKIVAKILHDRIVEHLERKLKTSLQAKYVEQSQKTEQKKLLRKAA